MPLNNHYTHNLLRIFRKKSVSEAEMIEGCLAGNREMQKLLYDRFAATMKGVCLRYSKTTFEAEDIMQDAFLKVFKNIDRFKGDCPLEGWVRRVTVNTALSHLRSRLHKNEATETDEFLEIAEPETVMSSFAAEELMDLVRSLPPKYQAVFNLFAIEGYSYKEISEMLEVPEVTCRSQYMRARTILRELVEKSNKMYHEKIS